MVTLLLDSAQMEVALSGTERALSFRRDGIRVPREEIEKVQLTDDLWTWIRGVRSLGTSIPGVVSAGTWTSIAGDDFLMVRGRKPGVVIDLVDGAEFSRLLLTTRHGLALVEALRLDVDGSPVEVTEIVATASIPTVKPARTRPARPATA